MKTTYYGVFCEYYKNGEIKIAIIPKEAKNKPRKRKVENAICHAYEFWFSSYAAAKVIKTNIEKYFKTANEINNYYFNFPKIA
jgi:hypothetical protein